ncbi:DUF4382 domain-containing protein [Compostibacter hankyongensis]|uniref:DUF4382 domain-containing protein n=1 Tax=Compostibacter hankyongensis TaxID=1007089 RepID=A0ABP8FKK3_9BACT
MKKQTLTAWGAAAFLLLTAVSISGITGCQKSEDQGGNSRLEIYLTDSPGDYQAVWIDVQKVMVNSSSDTSDEGSGWVEAPLLRPGLYNLLDLRNGTDTILAAVDLPAGRISQIRLVLGDSNLLVLKDGTEVPLKTPSAQQSGLKLNVNADLTPGIPYALVLDFDAARSIVSAGKSGQYLLKPVIRTFAKAAGGAIEGVVLPDSAHAVVTAVVGTDTLGTIPDDAGAYKLWGIPAGSYQLIFAADTATGFRSDTLSGVQVNTGEVTTADTVWLTR